jgi:CRISPR-associated endonuclease Cas3-HD
LSDYRRKAAKKGSSGYSMGGGRGVRAVCILPGGCGGDREIGGSEILNLECWQTKVLWAKKAKGNQDKQWLPLMTHMSDAAEIAKWVWHQWLPPCTKRKIARGINLMQEGAAGFEDAALPCFVFLAAGHDLGKAIPAFQGKLSISEFDEQLRKQLIDAGLTIPNYLHPREARHFWASQLILERYGFSQKLAGVLGGHHGQPPGWIQLNVLRKSYQSDLGWKQGQEAWSKIQQELLAYALELADVSEQEVQSWQPDITAQVLLSGLVIMVDWIVSNESYFPYIDLSGNVSSSVKRAKAAWKEINLPECWNPDNSWMGAKYFEKRFELKKPRPVQTAILNLLGNVSRPGIVILEAPMGEGKTEASLAATELLANKTKRNGVFLLCRPRPLPTVCFCGSAVGLSVLRMALLTPYNLHTAKPISTSCITKSKRRQRKWAAFGRAEKKMKKRVTMPSSSMTGFPAVKKAFLQILSLGPLIRCSWLDLNRNTWPCGTWDLLIKL